MGLDSSDRVFKRCLVRADEESFERFCGGLGQVTLWRFTGQSVDLLVFSLSTGIIVNGGNAIWLE